MQHIRVRSPENRNTQVSYHIFDGSGTYFSVFCSHVSACPSRLLSACPRPPNFFAGDDPFLPRFPLSGASGDSAITRGVAVTWVRAFDPVLHKKRIGSVKNIWFASI